MKGAGIVLSLLMLSTGQFAGAGLAVADDGTTHYTTYYTVTLRKVLDLGEGRQQAISEFGGITHNDEGKDIFNNMTVHCFSSYYSNKNERKGTGACKEMDRDGDQVVTTFDFNSKNSPPGVHTLVGGTGKYQGITGKAEYAVEYLRGPVEGDLMFIVPHTATWHRP